MRCFFQCHGLGHCFHSGRSHNRLGGCFRCGVIQNEFAHFRVDHIAPAAAAENAVVTGTRNFQVLAILFGNACAQPVGCSGLA